jgi:hypothetical protein
MPWAHLLDDCACTKSISDGEQTTCHCQVNTHLKELCSVFTMLFPESGKGGSHECRCVVWGLILVFFADEAQNYQRKVQMPRHKSPFPTRFCCRVTNDCRVQGRNQTAITILKNKRKSEKPFNNVAPLWTY